MISPSISRSILGAVAVVAMRGATPALALPPEPASAPAAAQLPAAPAGGGAMAGITPSNSGAPMDISAAGAEVFQPQHLTIFRGNVEVTQDQTRLRTPELRIFSKAKAATPGQPAASASPLGIDSSGGVDHIEAAGPVYYITPTESARGDSMLYESAPDVITLTGHVVLVQGKSVGKGDKLVINRKTGESNLISDAPQSPTGRVRVILYPQQQQTGAAPAPARPHS